MCLPLKKKKKLKPSFKFPTLRKYFFLDFLVSEEYDPIHYPEYSKHCTQSKFKTQQTFRSKQIVDNKLKLFTWRFDKLLSVSSLYRDRPLGIF